MLIGIDSSPCRLSLETEVCSTTKCHQNKSDLKNVFVQKFFFSISILLIPIMLIGINSGYFPAICRVCFDFLDRIFFLRGLPNPFIVHSRPGFLFEPNFTYSLMVFVHMPSFNFDFLSCFLIRFFWKWFFQFTLSAF